MARLLLDEGRVERIALEQFKYEFGGTPEEHAKGEDGWCTADWMDAIRDNVRFVLAAVDAEEKPRSSSLRGTA